MTRRPDFGFTKSLEPDWLAQTTQIGAAGYSESGSGESWTRLESNRALRRTQEALRTLGDPAQGYRENIPAAPEQSRGKSFVFRFSVRVSSWDLKDWHPLTTSSH